MNVLAAVGSVRHPHAIEQDFRPAGKVDAIFAPLHALGAAGRFHIDIATSPTGDGGGDRGRARTGS